MKRVASLTVTMLILLCIAFSLSSCNKSDNSEKGPVLSYRPLHDFDYIFKVDIAETEYDIDDVSVNISMGHKINGRVLDNYAAHGWFAYLCAGRAEQFQDIDKSITWFVSPRSVRGEFDNLIYLEKFDNFYSMDYYCTTGLDEMWLKTFEDFDWDLQKYDDAHHKWLVSSFSAFKNPLYKFPFSNSYTLPAELFAEPEGRVVVGYGESIITRYDLNNDKCVEEDCFYFMAKESFLELNYRLSEDGKKVSLSHITADYVFHPALLYI